MAAISGPPKTTVPSCQSNSQDTVSRTTKKVIFLRKPKLVDPKEELPKTTARPLAWAQLPGPSTLNSSGANASDPLNLNSIASIIRSEIPQESLTINVPFSRSSNPPDQIPKTYSAAQKISEEAFFRSKALASAVKEAKSKEEIEALLEKGSLPDRYTVHSLLTNCNISWQDTKDLFYSFPDEIKDSRNFTLFIECATKEGDFRVARHAFEDAKKQKKANNFTYTVFIKAAGKNGNLHAVKTAFEATKALGLANNFVYSAAIDALGKNGDFPSAKKIFEEIENTPLADQFVYNAFMEVSKRNNDFVTAEKCFAKVQTMGVVDEISHNVFIDTLIRLKKDIKRAFNVFQGSNLKYPISEQEDRTWIDLHGLSHGVGIVAIYQECLKHPKDCSFSLCCITGKGKRDDNRMAFKKNLIEWVKDFFPEASCEPGPNSGCININNLKGRKET